MPHRSIEYVQMFLLGDGLILVILAPQVGFSIFLELRCIFHQQTGHDYVTVIGIHFKNAFG